ncbi:hypothetical protein GCM10023079_38470 [Streptomyces chitinivorans]
MADEAPCPSQVTPAAPAAPALTARSGIPPPSTLRFFRPLREFAMDATARRRPRHTARDHHDNADRRNAAAALQRALDRRDNGGATGH